MDMLSFAERLKKLRKLNNKLQREVAELLGVTERLWLFRICRLRDFSPNEDNRDEFWVKLHRFMRMTKDIRPIVIPLLPRLLKNEMGEGAKKP